MTERWFQWAKKGLGFEVQMFESPPAGWRTLGYYGTMRGANSAVAILVGRQLCSGETECGVVVSGNDNKKFRVEKVEKEAK